MPPPRTRTVQGLGSWVFALVLVGMMVLSIVTSWRLRQSWNERERMASAALEGYARLAARTFLIDVADEAVDWRHFIIQGPIEKAVQDRWSVIPFDRFADSAETNIRNTGFTGEDPMLGFVRVDRATGAIATRGSADSADVRAFVFRALANVERPYPNLPVPFYFAGDVRGRQVMLMAYPQRAPDNRELAIFGVIISRRSVMEVSGRRALNRLPVLPPFVPESQYMPTMVGIADSLLAVGVTDGETGAILFESRPAFAGTITGEATAGATPRTQRAVVTLSPIMIARYKESVGLSTREVRRTLHGSAGGGGLASAVPVEWFLPAFSFMLAIAAAVHLWREQRLLRARRDFVASVSHELRTPLAQIRMFSETLQLKREENEEERAHWLSIISRESRRLGDLVENILLFSSVDAARMRLEKERTDLGELVEEVVEAYVPIAVERGMRIVADAPSRILVQADPRAMRQVIVNLLDNALKYGPRGQTVTVELERIGTVARMMVSDQGPGVPAGERERLWAPFVRLGTSSTTGGSGIGLAVVRAIVEQHGATIRVTDAPGGGARFVVELGVEASGRGSGIGDR